MFGGDRVDKGLTRSIASSLLCMRLREKVKFVHVVVRHLWCRLGNLHCFGPGGNPTVHAPTKHVHWGVVYQRWLTVLADWTSSLIMWSSQALLLSSLIHGVYMDFRTHLVFCVVHELNYRRLQQHHIISNESTCLDTPIVSAVAF